MAPASGVNETPVQLRSDTQRTLRGQIFKKDRDQINPCMDLLRQKKTQAVSRPAPALPIEDVVEEATFPLLYDLANDDESQSASLMGPRKNKDWWDKLVTTGRWLEDEV